MRKILIHTLVGTHTEKLIKLLEANLPHQFEVSHEMNETLRRLDQKIYHLILFDCVHFTDEDYRFLRDLRGDGYSFPILILAERTTFTNFNAVRARERLHWLQKPFMEKELIGISRKLLHAKLIPQQMHRRFRTNQNVILETLLDGQIMPTSMYNLSRGGAYFEFQTGDTVAIGDLVRMNVELPDMEARHQLNARVVWTTRKGRYSGRSGAGFRFVKEDDIYRYLAEKI